MASAGGQVLLIKVDIEAFQQFVFMKWYNLTQGYSTERIQINAPELLRQRMEQKQC